MPRSDCASAGGAADDGALDETLEQVEDPYWQLERSSQWGNLICFDECRSAKRSYRVDEHIASVLAELGPRRASAGFVNSAVDTTYGRFVRRSAGPDHLIWVRSSTSGETSVSVEASLS